MIEQKREQAAALAAVYRETVELIRSIRHGFEAGPELDRIHSEQIDATGRLLDRLAGLRLVLRLDEIEPTNLRTELGQVLADALVGQREGGRP